MADQGTVMKNYSKAMDASPIPPMPESEKTEGKLMATPKKPAAVMIPVLAAAVVLGIGTGYLLFMNSGSLIKSKTPATQTATETAAPVVVGKTYGSPDSETFKDSAEGVLLVGGVGGEGSHHIVREGGESQNVYLTSSVVDLNQFVGHSVVVKGETFKAQRAGWLMDVGQVKVLELNAELPAWAKKAAEQAEMKGSGN